MDDGMSKMWALLLVGWVWCAGAAAAATYYVASGGDDNADGVSPAAAWRTLARVNAAELQPGDQVRFRAGDSWRGQLVAQSGEEGAPIFYGSCGHGAKPVLLGSVAKNRPEDWVKVGPTLWATLPPRDDTLPVAGFPTLTGPPRTRGASGWNMHGEQGGHARGSHDASDFHSPPASCGIVCNASGAQRSHIQFYTGRFPILEGRMYALAFWAKADTPFDLGTPVLMKSGPPYSGYSWNSPAAAYRVGTDWKRYEAMYVAKQSAEDARLTFFLGGSMPAGSTLWLDDVELEVCNATGMLVCDVGNIIFNNEAFCGVKVWNEADLDETNEFWYDEVNHVVELCAPENPAKHYSDIECALRRHIIDQSNRCHVVYDGLALKYGAAHGIGGGSTHHITVRHCDVSFIGGGDQRGGSHTVRYGNGIEFWGTAHDHLVEACRLWEIYDAALTNQSSGPKTPQYNIIYRNNIIWNSEYSFEYWNRPEASETYTIRFEHNSCFNAGAGWGHTQRPDPSGRHLCFYSSPARAHDIFIRNNIFCGALKNAFYAPHWTAEAVAALKMDHNCWFQAEGFFAALPTGEYPLDAFDAYRKDTGLDAHSFAGLPGYVNPEQRDFHLKAASPCIDAGCPTDRASDCDGARAPRGKAPDLGAFEFSGDERSAG